jgi:hypothetical protein
MIRFPDKTYDPQSLNAPGESQAKPAQVAASNSGTRSVGDQDAINRLPPAYEFRDNADQKRTYDAETIEAATGDRDRPTFANVQHMTLDSEVRPEGGAWQRLTDFSAAGARGTGKGLGMTGVGLAGTGAGAVGGAATTADSGLGTATGIAKSGAQIVLSPVGITSAITS